jgi:hypothetical protein
MVVDMAPRSMAVVVGMAPIDTTVLLVTEQVRTQVPNTGRVGMEDWGGQTAMRQQQQKTNETLCLGVQKIGMHSGPPYHQAMGGQVEVMLLSPARLAKREAMAHTGKKDNSRPRRKRKKMWQQLNNRSVS